MSLVTVMAQEISDALNRGEQNILEERSIEVVNQLGMGRNALMRKIQDCIFKE